MGIDGIGKRGGIAPADSGSVAGTQKTGKTFELQEPARTEAVRGSSALDDFRAGRIDLDGYLDRKIDAATAHLDGLPATDLSDLRGLLRQQLANDPGLAELVQQATGQAPPAAEGE